MRRNATVSLLFALVASAVVLPAEARPIAQNVSTQKIGALKSVVKKTKLARRIPTTTKKKLVITKTASKTTTPAVTTTSKVPVVQAAAASAAPVDVVYGGNLIPDPTTTAAPGTPTTVGPSTTTTTVAPPSPAGPATRATAAGIDPYRGLGAWADGLDWMACPYSSKTGPGTCQNPKFNVAKLDELAANGVQTLFLQITRTSNPVDVPEPERLIPLIDRAHALGMYVVGWYIPAHLDVNFDLRRAVNIAGLDLDGISIDIESNAVADVPTRNTRLQSFAAQLRTMLPGRAIGATILSPVFTDDPKTKLWPNFNPTPLVPFFDSWLVMDYFTDYRKRTDVPWRDPYLFTLENINRLRQRIGADKPIHVVGGVADQSTGYDVSRFTEAAVAAGGIIGGSYYDWLTMKVRDQIPYLWAFRSVPDQRFVPAPFVPPTTSTTTTTIVPPPTVGVAPLAPTVTVIG